MGNRTSTLLLFIILILPGCTTGGIVSTAAVEESLPEGIACNGQVELCLRSYDDVTFPETHNSFATHEDGILYPQATIKPVSLRSGMQAFVHS